MPIVRKQAGTRTIGLRIHTFRFDDESGRCRASGECEVCRSSPPPIPPYTITSISKGVSTPGQTTKPAVTPPFANGGNCLSPDARSSAISGGRFELV